MAILKWKNWSRVSVVATYAELDALEFPFIKDLDIEWDVKYFSLSTFSHFLLIIFTNILPNQQNHVL